MSRPSFRGGYRGRRGTAFDRDESSSSNRSSTSRGSVVRHSNRIFSLLSNAGTHSQSSVPHIGYDMLCEMRTKEPDELIIKMSAEHFQLGRYLSDDRMKTNFQWLEMLTTLFERILACLGQDKRVAEILIQLPGSVYFNALHEEIRQKDPSTGKLRFNLILQALKIIDRLLTYSPHAESAAMPFIERIGTHLIRLDIENEEIKQLHSQVLEKAEHIYHQEQEKTQAKKSFVELRPPPDNFRLLNIIPSMSEILSPERIYLRQNIVEQGGSYEDSNHYLDIHFRLFREDFLGPLRDGIQAYVSNSTSKNTDVRIYENVFSTGPKLHIRCGLVYGLRLDRKKFGKIQWTNSRRLIYGSLLALTSDQFQSCIFVTVEDRSTIEKDLTLYVRPYIESNDLFVNHDSTKLDLLINQQFLTMIETTSYFEAYRHVLHALQKISSQQFPLAPYILHLSHDVTPPDYVTSTTQFDFTPLLISKDTRVTAFTQLAVNPMSLDLNNKQTIFRINYDSQNVISKQCRRVTLLNDDEWPTADEMHLNQKQHEALKLALTKKVALIQGPPGTGKTFLGVKIAELLLHNRSVWCPSGAKNTPILMVCQTNHALDQFLEHIITRLNMKDGLIRVGGRSKNETILQFSLVKIRQHYRANRLIPSLIHGQKRDIMQRKTVSQMKIQSNETTINASYSFFTSLSQLYQNKIIEIEHYNSLIGGSGHYFSTDKILTEWLGLNGGVAVMNSIEDDMEELNIDEIASTPEEDNEEQEEELRRRDETAFDDEFFRPTKISSKIIHISNDDEEDGWKTVVNKEKQKYVIYQLLAMPTKLSDEVVQTISKDLWLLTIPERHDLYRYWLGKYRENVHKSVSDAHFEFNRSMAEHYQYLQLEDYYILKNAIIVAMTTTCAAKYFDVLQKLECRIVIVEEAAEIFEAHVVTSLSPKCEHLILIGDHVQLRPSPSVYKLAVNYKIDVSLFERFVKNDFPNVRLNIQHRMRPELCKLMLHFYDNLQNHASVLTDRPAIIGVKQNLFFINHNHPEEMFVEGNSKQNRFEAEYILALAHFLIKQGYETSKITILVMYLGQRALISRLLKMSPYSKLLQGIRINVTDSFQGEENDIILLSLVRSMNKNNTIGFLKIHNRICVTLSRARCAMYIVGNLDFLMEHEDMWKKIEATLLEGNAVGSGLPLCCLRHPENEDFIADTAESFSERPEGGCKKMCGIRLACGHACPKFCHNYSHDRVQCTKPCNAPFHTCEHRCQRSCHSDSPDAHGICQQLVEKTVEPCQHTISMACGIEPTSDKCTYKVPVRLPCDHIADVTCAIRTSGVFDNVSCPEPCKDDLLCTHQCSGTCGECKAGQLHLPCTTKSDHSWLCTHSCQTWCGSNHLLCSSNCETSCMHSKCSLACGEPCPPCRQPCTNACEHEACSRLCSEPCDRQPCKLPCLKTNANCGHPCIGLCGDPCPPQCRICNKSLVQEHFYDDEDKPYSRFIHLSDCNHLFEVTGLDRYMNNFMNDQKEGREPIGFPQCPRCHTKIRHCQRYIPMTNQIQSWIEQIKIKQQNGMSSAKLVEQRDELRKTLEDSFDTIKLFEDTALTTLTRQLNNKRHTMHVDELNYMKNTCEFFKEINRLLTDGQNKLIDDIFTQKIASLLRHLINYISKQCQDTSARNYTPQQLNDLQNELRRIRCMINYYLLSEQRRYGIGSSQNDHFVDMKMLTHKSSSFTREDYQRFNDLKEKFQNENFLSGFNLIKERSLSIVDTLQTKSDHWFACPNDHVYNIDQIDNGAYNHQCLLCSSKKPLDNRRRSDISLMD